VVADALSRRSHVSQLVMDSIPFELCEEFDKLNLRIVVNTEAMEMEEGSSLLQEIQRDQLGDEKVQEIKHNIKEEKSPGFSEDDEGVLWYKGRICVPNVKELKDKILHEAHESAYSICPRGNKMYYDFKSTYWWYGMKRDTAEYVALCDTCQRVKAEHQRPARLLQPLQVPEWKCEEIAMDFIVGLPRTQPAMIPFG
jgi:uncharacterized protein involved in tolerance to divalent cations